MKTLTQSTIALLLAGVVHAAETETGKPPAPAADHLNVLMILADDLGWSDTTLYGTTALYETPNLERLAARGMTFTRAYAASPLCSPTRASILTGQNPARLGLTTPNCHLPDVNLQVRTEDSGPPGEKVTPMRAVSRLDTKYPTLGKVLQGAGYATGHFGKWHLGAPPYSPLEQGFEIDLPAWPGPGPGTSYIAPWSFSDKFKEKSPREHIEDRMAAEAVDWMQASVKRERPFYAQYWQFSVHGPWQAKPELFDRYREKIDLTTPQNSPTYAAMVHSFDEAVGTLLDGVDRSGEAERTVIIFFSDNGGNIHSPVDGTVPTDNAPLRGGKATMFEGGIRVPAIIVWPGVTEPGSRSDAIIQSTDLYPTILSMLGLPLPPDHPVDGENLTPLLRGEKWERTRPIITYFPHNPPVHDWLPPSMAVHEGDHKLIRLFHQGEDGAHDYLLYNLREDIGETTNLAAREPGRVQEMDRMMDDYIKAANVITPLRNPDFDPAQYRPQRVGVQNADGKPRPPVIPDRVASRRVERHAGWVARRAEFEPVAEGVFLHQKKKGGFIGNSGLQVKAPAVLEIQLKAPANGPGRVEWRTTAEKDFGKDSGVDFRVSAAADRVSVPLPVPAGQTIDQLRLYLPHRDGPVLISEISLRGEDGTETIDRFNAGVQ
jgi:arylsulfatase A-like enzyme